MIVGIFLGFIISVSTIIIYLLRKLKVKKRFLAITPIIIISLFTSLWLLGALGFLNKYNYIIIFIITNLFITYLYYKSKLKK